MKTNLQRFVDAQSQNYDQALAQIKRGRKTSHWMWYVFPQIQGLGVSRTSQRYAIENLDEARAYLKHPLLGQRLTECTESLLALEDKTAEQIFGYPDVLKLCSSLTLFEYACETENPFSKALEKYFNGRRDERTLKKLQ